MNPSSNAVTGPAQPAPPTDLPESIESVIRTRRTVKRFADAPVSREMIRWLLDAAVWAPNHRLNEPWRFHVFQGDALRRLGEIAAKIQRGKLDEAGVEAESAGRKAAQKGADWADLPAVIYVTVQTDPDPGIDLENYGAACCVVQNLALLAHANGLGTSWSSGGLATSQDVRRLCDMTEDQRAVGLIRLGWIDPEQPSPTSRRHPATQFTTWVA